MLGSNRPHDLNSAIIFFYIRLPFLLWQEVNLGVHLHRKILLRWCATPINPNPVWVFLTQPLGIIHPTSMILQPALFLPVWAFMCAVLLPQISFHSAPLVNFSFLFQGTPPKPPRRQAGWAEESSSKYVLTAFAVAHCSHVEGRRRAPWSFWVMRY